MLRSLITTGLAGLLSVAGAGGANAQSGAPITIGMVAELSGPLGFFGQETSRAAQIIVNQTNASGGILGRPLKLVVRDSKSTVNEAVRHARDLAFTDNVDILMHSINSAECIGVASVAKQARKIMFSSCGHDDLTGKEGAKYIFRIPNITARTQGYAAAEYVAKTLKPAGNRFYTIAHDFAFPRGSVDNFKAYLKTAMPAVQYVGENWPKVTEASYASFITAMIEAKPDVVYYAWAIGIPFWQQSASYELPKKFALVSSYWGGADDLQRLSKDSIPTGAVMGGFPWYAIEGPLNEKFVSDFRAAHNAPPFTPAYFQLITMQALRTGIEKAGTIEADALIAALEGLRFDSILGPITIRPFDHQGTTPYWTGKAAWDDRRNIGVITDVVKLDTDSYLPSEDEIKKARGQ